MFKNKTPYFYLLLLTLLIPLASRPQVQNVSRYIAWGKPAVYTINDSVISNIYFEGAYYSSVQSLPLYTEIFFEANISDEILVENCSYIPANQEELTLIHASPVEVPGELYYSSKRVTSRKKNGIAVEILPFIKDKISGQVLKLASFELRFSVIDQPAETTTRTYAPNSILSKGEWYKLAVTQTGIHRLGYGDLVAMGINPATLNPARIGIFSRGGAMLPEAVSASRADDLPENAIEVTGQNDGSFDQGDQILFYAQGPVLWKYNSQQQFWEHTTHLYTDTICYFLTTDMGSGKRVTLKASSAEAATDEVDAFDFYTTFEENNFNLVKSGRQWFAQVFDVIPDRSYTFDLIPALAAGGEVSVRSVTAAKSVNASSFEFSIGNQSWASMHSPISVYPNSPVASGSTSYKSLQSVTLPLKIDVKYNRSSSTAAGYLDFLDVNARCDLRFSGGQIDFRDSRSKGNGRVASYNVD